MRRWKTRRTTPEAIDPPATAPRDSEVQDLLENSPDLIQIVSPEGRYRYVNAAWRHALGYSSEEATELTLRDVVHPDFHRNLEDAKRITEEFAAGRSTVPKWASQPGLRVLFMSGYTEGVISHQGVLSKGVALLEKPFSRQTLTRAVREALDLPPSH